jgi:hypothetical protein
MDGIDVLKTFFEALETKQYDEARQYLSGNFVMTGWAAQPLNKYQFLDLIVALKRRMPELAFHLQSSQEDYQLAQSDRVEADMQVTGVQTSEIFPRTQESRVVSLPCGHVSFTIMGDTIESMIATPVPGGIEEIVMQLIEAGAIQGREESLFTQDDGQSQEERDNLHEQEQSSADEQARRYNKQSNLYDPQGKSSTPSRNDPNYAPQVDASAIAQGKPDNPAAPLFDDWQEQRELTSREPNRQNQKEND